MLVFEPFVVVRLAAPFTIPQKISIAERKGVTSLDSLKASVKVPWSCPRLAIKLIGNLERVGKKEGRRQAYRGVGDFGAAVNKRAVGKGEGREEQEGGCGYYVGTSTYCGYPHPIGARTKVAPKHTDHNGAIQFVEIFGIMPDPTPLGSPSQVQYTVMTSPMLRRTTTCLM